MSIPHASGRRLPPLNALRAFEAAGRLSSFTRAAAELHVTQAAISHQVAGLEERLGVRLFDRHGRALALTPAGEMLLPALTGAFDGIAQSVARLLRERDPPVLTLSVMPSFAVRWLVPRLARFRSLHPARDVRLSTTDRLVDFAEDDIDLAIRFGAGGWPGLTALPFLTEDIFPVCSPALLDGPVPLREPADLARHTLIRDEFDEFWRMWLLAAGTGEIEFNRGPSFTDSSLALDYAAQGGGVAMTRSVLAADDLKSGRLVKPFAISLPSRFRYYLVFPERNSERVRDICDWLFAEAGLAPSPAARAPARDDPSPR